MRAARGFSAEFLFRRRRSCFGDATVVQKQAFLLESMPQYVELEVGQSISKLVYFPRMATTRWWKDRVMFISEFGKEHEMSVKAAILIKPKGEEKGKTE